MNTGIWDVFRLQHDKILPNPTRKDAPQQQPHKKPTTPSAPKHEESTVIISRSLESYKSYGAHPICPGGFPCSARDFPLMLRGIFRKTVRSLLGLVMTHVMRSQKKRREFHGLPQTNSNFAPQEAKCPTKRKGLCSKHHGF